MRHPEVQRLAERQLGVVTRTQLIAVGVPATHVEHLVRVGTLRPILAGTYRVAGVPEGTVQTAMASVLRAGASAAVSGPYVLGLLRVEGFGLDESAVLLRQPGQRIRGLSMLHVSDPAPELDRAWFGPLAITTDRRALVESADPRLGVSDARLLVAYDDLRFRGRLTEPEIRKRVEALPRHRGAARWRRLLDTPDAVSESAGEREMGHVLDSITPRPRRQVSLGRYRVDFLYDALRLIFEYDGVRAHSSPSQRAHDVTRDAHLTRVGYRTDRFGRDDLRYPAQLRQRVVRRLRDRADELGLRIAIG